MWRRVHFGCRMQLNKLHGVSLCLNTRKSSHFAAKTLPQDMKTEYDAIIIGAGHNGLVAAAYLQKSGLNVCVLERRHVIGGAAVTEEIIPGFKFSRASYVLSLLRPQIIKDLELKKHGLKVYLRDPNSYTPVLGATKDSSCRSLILGRDESENYRQIAQFSKRDADAFTRYEHQLAVMGAAIEPLLDSLPVDIKQLTGKSISDKIKAWPAIKAVLNAGYQRRCTFPI